MTQHSSDETLVKQSIALLVVGLMLSAVTLPAYASCSDHRSPGVDWSGCKKSHKMLNQQNFSNARFDGANMSLGRLDHSDFTGASLVKLI